MLIKKYLCLVFILGFCFLGCDKQIIINRKIGKGKVVINKKEKSIPLKTNQKFVLKSQSNQLTLIFKNVSISDIFDKSNKLEESAQYQWELITDGEKSSGIEKSYIVYKKELDNFNKVSKTPGYLLTKIKGTQKIQHGTFHLRWSWRDKNSVGLTYPSDLTLVEPVGRKNGARTPTNIPIQGPLPAKLQTTEGLDDYFNLIKDNYNDGKFDDIYAMYIERTKTNLNPKDNRKGLALRQKQYGKILNGAFSHYKIKEWEEYKIFILCYQVKTSKLNGYFTIRVIENKDGSLGLWGTSLTKDKDVE